MRETQVPRGATWAPFENDSGPDASCSSVAFQLSVGGRGSTSSGWRARPDVDQAVASFRHSHTSPSSGWITDPENPKPSFSRTRVEAFLSGSV